MNRNCDSCRKVEGKFRCSVIMPEDTPPEDAVFVKDGIPYGYTYFYCGDCLAVQQTTGRELKVWEDPE